MKTSAVYLLLLVFCVGSRKSAAFNLFSGLFDYISEAFNDYIEYESSEEDAGGHSPAITINESELHNLIVKLCNRTFITPITTTKSTENSTTNAPTNVATIPNTSGQSVNAATKSPSTAATENVGTSSPSAATTGETTENVTTNPPPTDVDTNTNAPDSVTTTDDGETPPETP